MVFWTSTKNPRLGWKRQNIYTLSLVSKIFPENFFFVYIRYRRTKTCQWRSVLIVYIKSRKYFELYLNEKSIRIFIWFFLHCYFILYNHHWIIPKFKTLYVMWGSVLMLDSRSRTYNWVELTKGIPPTSVQRLECPITNFRLCNGFFLFLSELLTAHITLACNIKFPRINYQYSVSFSPAENEYESHFFHHL